MYSWVKKVFGFGVASFFSDFSHEMTVSLIPILVAQFVGAAQVPLFLGIISSISDAGASFLRIFAGFLSDRWAHKKPLIILGYGMSAVFSMLVGFAHSVWGILTFRLLSFTGSGVREPSRDALIATSVEPQYYGRAFGLQRAMDTLGALCGPLVTAACIPFFSMKEVFLLSLIPGILAVVAIVFLTTDVPTLTATRSVSLAALRTDIMRLPTSFLLFVGIVFIFDLSWFNKLLLLSRAQELLMLDATAAMQILVALYAFFNAARAGGEFTIGLLSDYVHRILLLAFLGCGLFALVAFLLMAPQASFAYCALVFVLAGISAAALTTLKKACAADMLPSDVRGLGYGVLQASEGVGSLISSAVVGFLWTHYSVVVSFSYVIILSTLAMFLLLFFRMTMRNLLYNV